METLAFLLYLFSGTFFTYGGFIFMTGVGIAWYRRKNKSKRQHIYFLKYFVAIIILTCAGWFISLSYTGTCFSMGNTIGPGYRTVSCEDENGRFVPISFDFLLHFFK